MAKLSGARRYAQAAFEVALERGEVEPWRADLDSLAQVIQRPELGPALENPRVPLQAKRNILRQALPQVNPLAHNLACLLVARGRHQLMGQVAAHFHRLADAHQGLAQAQVTTAIPLESGEMESLAQALGAIVGRRLRVEAKVDPAIVAGFRARVGDQLIDGSAWTKLQSMKQSLVRL